MGKVYSHKTELEPLFVRSFKQVIIRLHEKEKKIFKRNLLSSEYWTVQVHPHLSFFVVI